MTLLDSLVETLVAGINIAKHTTDNHPAAAAYAQVKALLLERHPLLNLELLERRPDSAAKQQSLAEDLLDMQITTDPLFLDGMSRLAEALVEESHNTPATIGVDLTHIRAAALKIQEVRSTGTGLRINDSYIQGDAEISDVQGGSVGDDDLDDGLDVKLDHVTVGHDLIIQGGLSAAHVTTLRTDYLHQLYQRADSIFLSHINAANPMAARLSLHAVYTTQLTTELLLPSASIFTPATTVATEEETITATTEPDDVQSAVAAISQHPSLVLLGAPGSGKSSFLKFVTLCMAGALLGDRAANLSLFNAVAHAAPKSPTGKDAARPHAATQQVVDPPPTASADAGWPHGPLLPVYIVLRELAAAAIFTPDEPGTAAHLMAYVHDELDHANLAEYAPYLQRELLEQGGLLLLDGLDEAPDQDDWRLQIGQAILDFSAAYPRCRIILTSRPYAYQDPQRRLATFAQTTLTPFGQWQIDHFIDQYYAYLARQQGNITPELLRAQTAALKVTVQQDRNLRELAATPLLLTLMVSLFAWRGGVLIDRREELYAQGIDLLLNEWERPKVEPGVDGQPQVIEPSVHEWLQAPQEAIRHALEALAFHAHANQAQGETAARIPEHEVVAALLDAAGDDARPGRLTAYIQNRAGLLIDHGDGAYSFPHRTIQEYLAACYLTRTDFPKQMASLVRADPQRWREVLLLAGEKTVRTAPFAVWALVDRLCPRPYATTAAVTPVDWWLAYFAGRLLVETELTQAPTLDLSEQETLDIVLEWLCQLLQHDQLPANDRAMAGADLGILGDPRPGIGRNEAGLPEIVWQEVAAGPFLMGADPFLCPLITAPYRISRYPITVAQYQSFVQAGGYDEPQFWTKSGWAWRQANRRSQPDAYITIRQSPNLPQTGISWYEAWAFCQWLSVQQDEVITLPSEAQWERAARHTDGRLFPWGDNFGAHLCNMRGNGVAQPSAVGIFPSSHAVCGAADMAGNVWEWCSTKWRNNYENYAKLVDHGPEGEERRVLRGGSWANEQRLLRCANRHRNYPDHRGPNVGFRVVALASK
ncbi:MAG: SUMF1/EgtB/PvdO family nonheme iron enzyme [Caldilineaceae bacterium]